MVKPSRFKPFKIIILNCFSMPRGEGGSLTFCQTVFQLFVPTCSLHQLLGSNQDPLWLSCSLAPRFWLETDMSLWKTIDTDRSVSSSDAALHSKWTLLFNCHLIWIYQSGVRKRSHDFGITWSHLSKNKKCLSQSFLMWKTS